MIRFTLLVLIAFSLSGCGLTTRQAQNLSDGLAGIEAVQSRVADDPVATAVLAGAHDHVEAVAEGETLPPPKRTPVAIAADPSGYAADAHQAMQDAQAIVPWWGWLAGAGAAALGVLRFIPGVGGAVADTAWRLLAPPQSKVADAKQELHAAGFQQLVQLIDGLRGEHTVAMLKADMAEKMPSSAQIAMQGLVSNVLPGMGSRATTGRVLPSS